MDKDAQLGEGHFISGQGPGICRLRAGSHNKPGQGWLFVSPPALQGSLISQPHPGSREEAETTSLYGQTTAGATEEADYLGR